MLSTRKIKTKKRLAVVKGAGQIERLEWRVYLVVLAFLMFVCTWLTLLVISASTLSLFFLLMWEPSTSVCSLFKIISELASVGFFRLIHCSSMAGRVGEEGLGGPGTGRGRGRGRVIMLGTIDTSFGSSHMEVGSGLRTDFIGHSKVMVLFS